MYDISNVVWGPFSFLGKCWQRCDPITLEIHLFFHSTPHYFSQNCNKILTSSSFEKVPWCMHHLSEAHVQLIDVNTVVPRIARLTRSGLTVAMAKHHCTEQGKPLERIKLCV